MILHSAIVSCLPVFRIWRIWLKYKSQIIRKGAKNQHADKKFGSKWKFKLHKMYICMRLKQFLTLQDSWCHDLKLLIEILRGFRRLVTLSRNGFHENLKQSREEKYNFLQRLFMSEESLVRFMTWDWICWFSLKNETPIKNLKYSTTNQFL